MNARVGTLAKRFPALSPDCDQDEPGVRDDDEWRDWTECETTPDQLRIEDYLDRFDLSGKSVLHVGIGNSRLARRFHRRASRIVGTTVVPGELAHARSLALPGYEPVLHNKYAGALPVGGRFDFILDNNPTTFCCCLTHLDAMLALYAGLLTGRGQIVTDRVGLGWSITSPGASPGWGFSFADLAAAARLHGLGTRAIGRNVIVLSLGKPPSPGPADIARHWLRRLGRKVASAMRRLALGAVRR
jgi:hypothetical protein